MATLGTDGVTTTSKNVFISIQNAGIGDAILIQTGADGSSLSHFKAIVGTSVQAAPPSGYAWYGVVYGREKKGLMIKSLSPTTAAWANTTAGGVLVALDSTNHANVINTTSSNGGIMRNGLAAFWGYLVAMSVKEVASRNASSTTTHIHPTSPYNGQGNYPMGTANFNADVSGAKTLYGTYRNYIAQLCPILKGVKSGVFQYRCGKLNTKELALNNSTDGYSFPAAQYCYSFKVASEASNHWWLPDMYELYMMMRDESFDNCVYAHSVLGGNTARAAYRWSSVRYGSTTAWSYANTGFSNNYYFYDGLAVCPVTLLTL